MGTNAPVMAQLAFERKEVFATTATIRSPIVRSAARSIRFEIRWKLSDKLPQEVVLRHAGSKVWFWDRASGGGSAPQGFAEAWGRMTRMNWFTKLVAAITPSWMRCASPK
jgi:hypothetical protein